MSWNLTRNIEILVDAPMVAERLTPSDFDELYRKDMEGGYRPDVRHHRPDCLCFFGALAGGAIVALAMNFSSEQNASSD